MDPNQEGQPAQGGSVPPTSPAPGMPPAQAGGSPAPTSGMPPAQPAGTPPAGSPVFGAQGTTTAADPSPTPVSTPAPAPGVLPASGAPATPPLTPRRSFRPAQTNTAQFGATDQYVQPAQGQPGIIASGNMPSAAGSSKKPSRGLVIGIIVVAVLIVAAVIVGIVASSGSKSGTGSSSSSAPINMSELSSAYNNLANYIAFGDENQGEGEVNGTTYSTREMLERSVEGEYSEIVLEADEMLNGGNTSQRNQYFQKFDQLYQQLPDNLFDVYKINSEDIYDYYHGFSTIEFVSGAEIIERYNQNGFESTRSYIENTVVARTDDRYIKEYTDYVRRYDFALLDLVNDAKVDLGCNLEINNINKCNLQSITSGEAYSSALMNITIGDAHEIRLNYRRAAVRALLNVDDLFNNRSNAQ